MIPACAYADILRRDLMSFIERSFYELNPQTKLLGAPHLELIAAKLKLVAGERSTASSSICRRANSNRFAHRSRSPSGVWRIIIDDPLKPDEALSESRRKAVNEWYDHTLLSRLNDKERGCIIIIMQRLHQDDLVGHVLEQEDWEVLSFAAIAEEFEVHRFESPLGWRLFKREIGEALHPERESAATLAQIRQTIREYNFSAQYQQNPTPLGGAMVKTAWLAYYEPGERPERFSQIVQSWDTANKATELSDYSVCTTWGVRDKRYYLLDVLRQRLNYPDLKRKVQDLASRHRPNKILIEDKASGTQLIQDLKADGVYAVTAYQPPPGTDKIMRLHAQTAVFENGRVLLPRRAPWLADYVNELTSFPGSRHDDQVDSTTQALDHLQVNRVVLITPEMLARARVPRRRPSRFY